MSSAEPTVRSDSSSFLAEGSLTFVIVYTATVAAAADQMTDGALGLVGQALALGMVSAACVSALGWQAPGLGNPAIALTLWMTGGIRFWGLARLVVAELIGACAGAMFARGLFPEEVLYRCRGGAPHWHSQMNYPQALVAELTLTLILLIALFTSNEANNRDNLSGSRGFSPWNRPQVTAGIAGLLTASFVLIAGKLTGGLANPARAFGPALAGGFWDYQAIYWIGPLLSSLIAALILGRIPKRDSSNATPEPS